MKHIAVFLVIIGSASAQLPPTCAIDCATKLALQTGCTNVADVACQCKLKNQALIAHCIQNSCSPQDATRAIEIGNNLCQAIESSSSSSYSSSQSSSSLTTSTSGSSSTTSSSFAPTTFSSSIASSAGYITIDHTVTVGYSSPSSDATASSNSGSNTPVGAIAGGTVGGVVALSLCAALLFFLRRRSKNSSIAELSGNNDFHNANQPSQIDGKSIIAELDSAKQPNSHNYPLDTSKSRSHDSTPQRPAAEMP